MQEARRHVAGETISNCWVKSGILPPLYENELHGGSNRKSVRGAAKFNHDFEQLAADLAKVDISDAPTAEELLTMQYETVWDESSNDVTQGEQEMETENEQTI